LNAEQRPVGRDVHSATDRHAPAFAGVALLAVADSTGRRLCEDTLGALGLAAVVAGDGVTLMTAARAEPPALVVLDAELPDAPGHEVLRWLRSVPALTATPVLLLNIDPEDEQGLAGQSRVAALPRPLLRSALRRTVLRLLDRDRH
jgi:DNA-binding response OmpR family regulator